MIFRSVFRCPEYSLIQERREKDEPKRVGFKRETEKKSKSTKADAPSLVILLKPLWGNTKAAA